MMAAAPGTEVRLLLVGLSHRTAPVRVREKAALGTVAARALVRALLRCEAVAEAVVLSTCNRTELYLVSERWEEALSGAEAALLAAGSISAEELRCARYVLHEQAAAEHLFAVVAGLDAVVVGENEIVAQARSAVQVARQERGLGALLEALFQRSFATARRVRAQTRIGHGVISVASVATELAENAFPALLGRSALIVGAGGMARVAAHGLRARGINDLVIANRTVAGARALAREVGGRAVALDAIGRELEFADIVIGATEAPHLVLTTSAIAAAYRARARPMLLIDLAVPRDIEASAGTLPSAKLYDIDDLQHVVEANLNGRRAEVPLARDIVRTEAQRFHTWREERAVAPTLRALRLRAETIRRATLEAVINGDRTLTNEELERLDHLSRALINKLLHEPTVRLRGTVPKSSARRDAEALTHLFALSELRV